MNNILPILTGDRAADLARHTAQSRKKVTAIGMSLLLVTGIWAGIGYLLGSVVLGMGTPASIIIAVAMAAIIFVVDRSIILVKAKGWHAWAVRIPLACLGAYLGTVGIDQALFDTDIRQVVADMRAERIMERERNNMTRFAEEEQHLRDQLAGAMTAHQEALVVFNAELDGTGRSSGYRGYGAVAKQKAKAVEHQKEQVARAQANLEAFLRDRDQQLLEAGRSAQAGFRDGALLERMVAFKTFLDRNPVAFWQVYLPLLLFMLLVELIPLYLKLATPATAYEAELAAAETLRLERAKAILREQQQWLAREAKLSVEAKQAEHYLDSLHRPTGSMCSVGDAGRKAA